MRAVKTPSFAGQHLEAMLLAGEIGATLRQMYRPKTTMIKPEDVIRLLNKAKVRFILMGTYGINGYRYEPRATQDVDVLVKTKDHEKAVAILRGEFPNLFVVDHPVVTRFLDPENSRPLIDVMKPTDDTLQAAFKYSVPVGKSHRIPDLEMALVSKFAAMVSPNRIQSKKLVDGGDFVDIVETNLKAINLKKMRRLAEMVYKGGGKEILGLVDDIQAGRRIVF
jgi:hypothetical protein